MKKSTGGLVVGDPIPNRLTEQEPDGRSETDTGRRLLVQARRFMRNKAAFRVFLEENSMICLIKDAEDLMRGGAAGSRARDRFFERGGRILKRMDAAGGQTTIRKRKGEGVKVEEESGDE